MRSIFLIGIIFAGPAPTATISETKKNQIMEAYTDQASLMSVEYEAYGKRALPLDSYNQVPDMRLHLPIERFKTEIVEKGATLYLDGRDELSICSYIKYTVYGDDKVPDIDFYMIIAWPREHDESEFSLLRIYKIQNEEGQLFLTRTAMTQIILRETYNTNDKINTMMAYLNRIRANPEWVRAECNKAKFTTGTNGLIDYSFSSTELWTAPEADYNIVVLNNEETYIVPGILYCNTHLGPKKVQLTYIMADQGRVWIPVKTWFRSKKIYIGDQQYDAMGWFIDDTDENN